MPEFIVEAVEKVRSRYAVRADSLEAAKAHIDLTCGEEDDNTVLISAEGENFEITDAYESRNKNVQ